MIFRPFRLVFPAILVWVGQVSAFELNEEPAAAGNWGYRPTDSSTAEQNPPSFSWRPTDKAAAYSLQIAEDEDFESVVYEVKETRWSAHCAPEALAPGRYFWRYTAFESDGKRANWSKVRSFTVEEETPTFPRPTLRQMLSTLPATHPRLFFRPEETDALRAAAAGDLKRHAEKVIAIAEKRLASPPDLSEPPLYPEGTERKGEAWKKIWWGNRTHGIAAMGSAADLAFAYQLTGDVRYGDEAKRRLMAVMDWDPKGSTQYNYNDEAAMPLLYWPSRVYTWTHDLLTEAEREKVRSVMTVRAEDCYQHLRKREHLWNPYASHSNRAWHWLAEVAVTFHNEIDRAPEWLDYATTIFYSCYPVWGDADGGWHEGTAYWVSYIDRFMYWAFISDAALDINAFNKPFFSETGYYGMYTLPPGTNTGAWGDQAQRSSSNRIARLMAILAAGSGNGHFQWFAESQNFDSANGWFGFVFAMRAAGVAAKAPDDLPSSRVFEGTGLAVLNSDLQDGSKNVQVHFKSSPFGRVSHGYNANNAFLLNLGGERVLLKSGKRDVYGSPHHKDWMWHTKSDNAILVNGEGQPKHSPTATGRIVDHQFGKDVDYVVGEAGDSYDQLDRWTRRLIFLKPHGILIHDILDAPEPATFQWLLHAPETFEIGEQSASWSGDPGTLDVQFLEPAGLAITQKQEFDVPPHEWAKLDLKEAHLTADATEAVTHREFITWIGVNSPDAVVGVARAEATATVSVTLPDAAWTVVLNPDEIVSINRN